MMIPSRLPPAFVLQATKVGCGGLGTRLLCSEWLVVGLTLGVTN